MGLEIKEGYKYNKEIRELFTEYANLVIAGDKAFIEYLKMQHFDQEIEHLEEKYGYPNGRLYIAFYVCILISTIIAIIRYDIKQESVIKVCEESK